LSASCKRAGDKLTESPNAQLSFSRESITFDTIFTSIGSVTKKLWVYNNNKHALSINSIRLGNPNTSSYKMIIDGEEHTERYDYILKGKDSMLVLVRVLINPLDQSLPYLVEDSIEFITNGNHQLVYLTAYGQDAHFLTNTTVSCNATWTNTKPYLINGNVTVPSGCTLTIDKGVRLLFHKNATLTVEGTLIAEGEKDSLVYFKNDNLSNFYNETPGQWNGIVFKSGSKNNRLKFIELKNAVNGITLQDENDADDIPELTIENAVIKNCSENGINAFNTDLTITNSLISNCISYLLKTNNGGNFNIDYCTMTSYSYDFFRDTPSILLSNNNGTSSNAMYIRFRNTIVWGDKSEEIMITENDASNFDFLAEHSLLKSLQVVSGSGNLFLQNPQFENEFLKKYKLKSSSPAVNSAIVIPAIDTDLIGTTRDASPDMGCYESF